MRLEEIVLELQKKAFHIQHGFSMNRFFASLLCILSLCMTSCSKKESKAHVIAYDASFLSIDAQGREVNIAAFLNDLTMELSKKTRLPITLSSVNWDTILYGLQNGEYHGVYSGMTPRIFNEKMLNFSNVLLPSGAVLLSRESSKVKKLEGLSNKEVGVIQGSHSELILEKYPEVIIRVYESAPALLNDLATATIEGAVLGLLPALGYVNDLYKGSIVISQGPLNDLGLRFVTQKPSGDAFYSSVAKALSRLESDGTLEGLRKKWGLELSNAGH